VSPIPPNHNNVDGGLPHPLPYPPYSSAVIWAEKTNTIPAVRAKLVRESARFYITLKYNLSPHYDEICAHLLKRFPELKDPFVIPGARHQHVSYVFCFQVLLVYFMFIIFISFLTSIFCSIELLRFFSVKHLQF